MTTDQYRIRLWYLRVKVSRSNRIRVREQYQLTLLQFRLDGIFGVHQVGDEFVVGTSVVLGEDNEDELDFC